MSACKSCGAEILWATTSVEGRTIPLDAQTVIGGNIEFDGLIAIVGKAGSGPYQSHFVSCPNAKSHRRKRGSHD
jgi:hypothetical protein